MAVISWGKPRIFTKDLDVSNSAWNETPTPIEDSTELVTTEGERLEAKIEGGENEDVRVKRSTYELNLNIRKAKGREAHIASEDGVVAHNHAVMLQPEDAECPGFYIQKSNVSVMDTYTAADGAAWQYKFSALKPESGSQVKWGIVTVKDGVPTFVETLDPAQAANLAAVDTTEQSISNPAEAGLYEKVGDAYLKSTDTTVNTGTTYYNLGN